MSQSEFLLRQCHVIEIHLLHLNGLLLSPLFHVYFTSNKWPQSYYKQELCNFKYLIAQTIKCNYYWCMVRSDRHIDFLGGCVLSLIRRYNDKMWLNHPPDFIHVTINVTIANLIFLNFLSWLRMKLYKSYTFKTKSRYLATHIQCK